MILSEGNGVGFAGEEESPVVLTVARGAVGGPAIKDIVTDCHRGRRVVATLGTQVSDAKPYQPCHLRDNHLATNARDVVVVDPHFGRPLDGDYERGLANI